MTQVHRRFRTESQATLPQARQCSSLNPVPLPAEFSPQCLTQPTSLTSATSSESSCYAGSSPPPSHCRCLSVPLRFRPSWRPPCSMPEIRGISKPRHPLGASSSPRLQRSWSQSHHTHPYFRSQHPKVTHLRQVICLRLLFLHMHV